MFKWFWTILIGCPCPLISYKLKIWKYVTIQDSPLIALTMSCLHEVDWNRIIENGTNCMNKLFSSFYKYNTIVNKQTTMKKNHLIAKQGSYINPGKLMELRRVLRLKINDMHLETRLLRYKHCRNKIFTLVRVSKRRYYDTLFENNMANMKKTWQGINELLHRRKKIKSHIDLYLSLKDFNNRTKLLRMVRGYLTFSMNTLQQSETDLLITCHKHNLDYVDKCKSPISSFLFQPVLPFLGFFYQLKWQFSLPFI